MKKLLSLILVITILFAFAACGKKSEDASIDDALIDVAEPETEIESDAQDIEAESSSEVFEEDTQIKENVSQSTEAQNTTEVNKPSEKPAEVPSEKPLDVSTQKPSEEKPAEVKPEPEQSTPSATTLGNTLLNDFKSKAASGMGALEIAEEIINGPAITFMGGAMPVEEGFLAGFDNYEVKGFKAGASFAPMIGSIPFVGYVFELEDASDASAFVSELKNNANLRWNICVEAEEMITGIKGNLVFFVMCPKSLEAAE